MEEEERLPYSIHTHAHTETHKNQWKRRMMKWSTMSYGTAIAAGVTFLATDSFLVDIFCLEIVTSCNLKNRETYGKSLLNGKLSMLLVLHSHSVGSLYHMFAWSLHIGCHFQESTPATVSGNYAQVARPDMSARAENNNWLRSFVLWIGHSDSVHRGTSTPSPNQPSAEAPGRELMLRI